MALELYDTAARRVREFVPLTPGQARIYLCGATVQAPPHVGHIRAGLVFDVLARWLRATGLDVVLCRNVTDIDDKILARASEEGRPWWAVAAHYEREFTWAYEVLGCEPPTVEPRATGHITQMIELIERLIDAGHAYAVGPDVYFDVRSWQEYGSLSGQKLDELMSATDSAEAADKRDPRDFALWKGAKPGEPSWPTPWGDGRPGWHIECSAMSTAYLGTHFDIHGGGLDLVFPHHENELAQSRAAGDEFAAHWVHNSWVTTAGEKMAKSLGNVLQVREVVRRARPIELRWYLVSAHYRSMLEFSDPALAESAASFRRIEGFVHRVQRAGHAAGITLGAAESLPGAFVAAMDDDLNTPAAVAVVHDRVHAGNSALDARDVGAAVAAGAEVLAMLDVLGVDPLSERWNADSSGGADLRPVVDALLGPKLAARDAARKDRDFTAADAIRDELGELGIDVEDSADGPLWSLRSEGAN